MEVNLSPSLSCSEQIDLNVKGNLLADLFSLVGIVPLDQRNYENVTFTNEFNVYANQYSQNIYGKGKKIKQRNSMAKRLQKNP